MAQKAKSDALRVIDEYDKAIAEGLAETASALRKMTVRNIEREGLVDSGALRKGIRAKVRKGRVQVQSDQPYATIYNFGGNIVQKAWSKPNPKRPRWRKLKGVRRWTQRPRTFISERIAAPEIMRVWRGVGRRLKN